MAKKPSTAVQVIPVEFIERKIYLIRGYNVMLGSDLAELYKVPTKVLNQAVRRHVATHKDLARIESELPGSHVTRR